MLGRVSYARVIGLAMIALSVTQLADAAVVYGKAWLAPILISRAYEESSDHDAPVKPWPWADTHPVAKLAVPKHGIERFVLAGDSGHAMAFGAGMAGGVRPGEPGMVMISGHRDTHFRFLKRLEPEDAITLQSHGERFRYRVVSMTIADAKEGYMPIALPYQGLLLVTCYPFDELVPGGTARYVVVAEREWEAERT